MHIDPVTERVAIERQNIALKAKLPLSVGQLLRYPRDGTYVKHG